MKKNLYLIGLCMIILVVGMVNAVSYYFSNSGSDASTTGNITNPYATIAKHNDLTRRAGDFFYWKCGDTWRLPDDEWLAITGGNSSGYITYTGYGSCSGNNKPQFFGSYNGDNNAWRNYTTNIWYYSYTDNGTEYSPNPSIDVNANNWTCYVSAGEVSGSCAKDSSVSYNGNGSFKTIVNYTGNSVSDVQVYERVVSVVAGQMYKVSFNIKANASVNMIMSSTQGGVKILNNTGTNNEFYNWRRLRNISVSTDWRGYSIYLNSSVTSDNGKIIFYFGNLTSTGLTIWLDNVSLNAVNQTLYDTEVGNIILNGDTGAGYKTQDGGAFNVTALTTQGDYQWVYDYDNKTLDLYMYSTTNPMNYYDSIEVAVNDGETAIFGLNNDDYMNFTGLDVKYGSAGGFSLIYNVNDVYVTGNEVSWCGGTWHHGDLTRYGDCIGGGPNSNRLHILRNNISDSADSCITTQSWDASPVYNNNISYNIMQRCPYGMVVFSTLAPISNLTIDHNTFNQIGDNYANWTDVDGRRGIRFGTMNSTSVNIVVTNNVFNDYQTYGIDLGDGTTTRWLAAAPTINYNIYDGNTTNIVTYNATTYKNTTAFCSAKTQECNGITSEPLLNTITLQPNYKSPACRAASDGTDIGAISCGYTSDTNNASVLNNTLTNITSSSLPEGTYSMYISCMDESGNYGRSDFINITTTYATAYNVTVNTTFYSSSVSQITFPPNMLLLNLSGNLSQILAQKVNQKNITASGQDSSNPLIKVINNNTDVEYPFGGATVKVKWDTYSVNFTVKLSSTNNISQSVNLTSSYQDIVNLTWGTTGYFWLWGSYNNVSLNNTPDVNLTYQGLTYYILE